MSLRFRYAWKMRQYPLKPNDVQHVAQQADLNAGPPQRVATQIFGNLVLPGDGDQFSAQLLTENPGFRIALDTGQGTATHRAVSMDVAIGQKSRTRADRGHDDQIATLGLDRKGTRLNSRHYGVSRIPSSH